ncbi:hypothetical protein KI387_020647, partial [Taxus chinensis]
TRLEIEGPPIKVPINATCEVEEPKEEANEEFEESGEEDEEELEELDGSQVNFLTPEGVHEENDYDEVLVDMNNDSYAVMT